MVLDVALPWTAAALPAPATTAERPLLALELAPTPTVEADVPPAAALPAVPPAMLPPLETFAPTVEAAGRVCATAAELARTQMAAIRVDVMRVMLRLLSTVDLAPAGR